LGKFRRKHISCRFCHGVRFPGEVILGSAGNVELSAGNIKLSVGNVKLFAGRK